MLAVLDMEAWWLGLAWRRLALAVLDYGGLVARASLAKAALAGWLLRRVEWALVALTAPGGD